MKNVNEFYIDLTEDGIAFLYWKNPDLLGPLFTDQVVRDLETAVRECLALADKGLVISASGDHTSASYSTDYYYQQTRHYEILQKKLPSPEAKKVLTEEMSRFSGVLRMIELSPIPCAFIVEGQCYGAGLELGLASQGIFLVRGHQTELGFPELDKGVFPRGGSVHRALRKFSLDLVYALFIEQRSIGQSAERLRFYVQESVSKSAAVELACHWIKTYKKQAYRQAGEGAPSSTTVSIDPDSWEFILNYVYQGHSPVTFLKEHLLSCIVNGAQLQEEHALTLETNYLLGLLFSKELGNYLRVNQLFMQQTRQEMLTAYKGTQSIKTIGVLVHSKELYRLTQQLASQHYEIFVYAQNEITLNARSEEGFRADRFNGINDSLASHANVVFIDSLEPFKQCQALLIEQGVLSEAQQEQLRVLVESLPQSYPVICFSTHSFGSVQSGASCFGAKLYALTEDANYLELYPFQQSYQTEALANASAMFDRIGLVTALTTRSRGFLAELCYSAYIREGLALFVEGVPPLMIERAGMHSGVLYGPLALADRLSLKTVQELIRIRSTRCVDDLIPHEEVLIQTMVTKNRLGENSQAGFYTYKSSREKSLWRGLHTVQARQLAPETLDFEEVKQRLRLLPTIDLLRHSDSTKLDIEFYRKADLASVLGAGFDASIGGVCSYIDYIGINTLLVFSAHLTSRYGARFALPEGYEQLLKKRQSIYQCTIQELPQPA